MIPVAGAAGNLAPWVSSGTDQTITLPTSTVMLAGTVSDDGQPNPPAAVTLSWTQTSGPAPVRFANASAASTTATFSTSGTYVLRLTADDSNLSAFSVMTVTVKDPAPNAAPVANAGADQTIQLPTAQVALSGAFSDDGQPNPPGAVTVTWSRAPAPVR